MHTRRQKRSRDTFSNERTAERTSSFCLTPSSAHCIPLWSPIPSSSDVLSGVDTDDPPKRAAPRFALALALLPQAATSVGKGCATIREPSHRGDAFLAAECHTRKAALRGVSKCACAGERRGGRRSMGALCHRFELGDACTLSSKPENAVSLSAAHMDESESRSDRLCAKYLKGRSVCGCNHSRMRSVSSHCHEGATMHLGHTIDNTPLRSAAYAKVFGNAEVIRSRSRSSQGKAGQGKARQGRARHLERPGRKVRP